MSDAIGITGSRSDSGDREMSRRAQENYFRQAQVVKEDIRELGHLGKEAAKELVGDAKRAAVDTYRHGKQRVEIANDRLMGYVQEHPMKSVLYAAAIGAVVGAIVTRRRHV